MSSIASSKRGRPNSAKNEEYVTIVGDFRPYIHAWWDERPTDYAAERNKVRDRMRHPLPEESVFEIELDCLSTSNWSEVVELDETLSVPKSTQLKRGAINVFRYTLMTFNRQTVVAHRFVVADNDATVVDLVSARTASESEIRAALEVGAESDEVDDAPEPAPAPTFKRLERNEGDSRLGFTIGKPERQIRTAPRWTTVGFHLASPQIIGRIGLLSVVRGSLEIAVFNAAGEKLIHADRFTNNIASFDEVRIPAGDNLLAFRGVVEGQGSFNYPNSLVLVGELPERPNLDAILAGPCANSSDYRCAVPVFQFGAL